VGMDVKNVGWASTAFNKNVLKEQKKG